MKVSYPTIPCNMKVQEGVERWRWLTRIGGDNDDIYDDEEEEEEQDDDGDDGDDDDDDGKARWSDLDRDVCNGGLNGKYSIIL